MRMRSKVRIGFSLIRSYPNMSMAYACDFFVLISCILVDNSQQQIATKLNKSTNTFYEIQANKQNNAHNTHFPFEKEERCGINGWMCVCVRV